MFRLLFPLRYLNLRNKQNRFAAWSDVPSVVAIAAVMSLPFIFLDVNYFGVDGFLGRFGSFSSVLTGFYIAALVGIATYKSIIGGLDEPIMVGPVFYPKDLKKRDGSPPVGLTRREYVCSMFGYLAFSSLVISMISILSVIVAQPLRDLIYGHDWGGLVYIRETIPIVFIVTVCLAIAHMLVTTCYGLYYLIDRLYAVPMVIVQPDEERD